MVDTSFHPKVANKHPLGIKVDLSTIRGGDTLNEFDKLLLVHYKYSLEIPGFCNYTSSPVKYDLKQWLSTCSTV